MLTTYIVSTHTKISSLFRSICSSSIDKTLKRRSYRAVIKTYVTLARPRAGRGWAVGHNFDVISFLCTHGVVFHMHTSVYVLLFVYLFIIYCLYILYYVIYVYSYLGRLFSMRICTYMSGQHLMY